MKTLFLTFGILFSTLSFSQTLIIQVDEVQSYYGDTTQTIYDVLNGQTYDYTPTTKNCRYVINMSNNFVDFYRNDILESSSPITINFDNKFVIVDLLENGFDVGLIVNLDVNNESVVLYDRRPSFVEYMKFTKFQIVKPQ
jgi:hypothetical protein